MFQSFFPKPRVFFPSVAVWIAVAVALWYSYGKMLGVDLGFPEEAADATPIIGLGYFATPAFIWFYLYCGAFTATFTAFWAMYAPHKYMWWSVAGSAFIVFLDYYNVQTSVVINYWQRPFWDAFQQALSGKPIPAGDFYHQIGVFSQIAFVSVGVSVVTRFFTSHYVFRWRMAMNDYYVSRWPEVRSIEGAAQRVQEDTMRFAMIVEELGISLVDSLLTLLAFLPVLAALSGSVKTLPIVGVIPEPLVFAAILWSLFGTVLLAAAGMKLPNLAFRNQRVEAAYRKELVYGEDDAARADPLTVAELFENVRKRYFTYYFHYVYFNVFRYMYSQADNVFVFLIMIPTVVAAKITFGIFNQIVSAFGQVSGSFQYLVQSWSTIIELLSIQKRLKAFEAAFEGRGLGGIEKEPEPVPIPGAKA